MNEVQWLQKWYYMNCFDTKCCECGVTIATLDNPGWYIKIDLKFTALETKQFQSITIERSENNWIFATRETSVLEFSGGPYNLEEMITIFRQWAEKN